MRNSRRPAPCSSAEDVLIVASVSCIYGLGSPEAYYGMLVDIEQGDVVDRHDVLRKLVEIQYERNDYDLARGNFRVRGDVIELIPGYDDLGVRIELFGDEVEKLVQFDPLTGKALRELKRATIFPKTHYVTPRERTLKAVESIRAELDELSSKPAWRGQATRGPAHPAAHALRSGDARRRSVTATGSRTTRVTSPAGIRATRHRR